MTNRQRQRSIPVTWVGVLAARYLGHRILLLALTVIILAFSACGTTTGGTGSPITTSPTTRPNAGTTPQATTTPTTITGYQIKVYFSIFPDSLQNYAAVFPVKRVSPTIAVATFAIQLLIAGPTLDERSAGYFSELNSILTGPSTCSAPYPTGGPDFTLALNKRGTIAEQGTATLRFCRATQSPGIGADARIQAEITTTLTQFTNIKRAVILTSTGHCFGDERGTDACLK